MRLTSTVIQALTLPAGVADRTYFDDDLPGFGLRLRAAGSKKWVVQYDHGGKTRRLTLGPVSALDPGEARRRAKDVFAARTLGRDRPGQPERLFYLVAARRPDRRRQPGELHQQAVGAWSSGPAGIRMP